MSSTAPALLFAEFPGATDAEWRRAAEESLDGAPFEKKLITRTAEGIDLQPIYTRSDGEKLGADKSWPGLPPYVRGAGALGSRAAGWFICQDPGCVQAGDFNRAVRDDLSRGQNAVILPLDTATRLGLSPVDAAADVRDTGLSLRTIEDVDEALRGVDLSAVPLFSAAGLAARAVMARLTNWLVRQNQPATNLHGAVLGDSFAEAEFLAPVFRQ
jgi:methylmalonyl-CoA mutase